MDGQSKQVSLVSSHYKDGDRDTHGPNEKWRELQPEIKRTLEILELEAASLWKLLGVRRCAVLVPQPQECRLQLVRISEADGPSGLGLSV
jgi:hypothetical protein